MWAAAPVSTFYNGPAFVRKGTVYLSWYTIQCEYMNVRFRRLHAIGVKLRCGTISVIICLCTLWCLWSAYIGGCIYRGIDTVESISGEFRYEIMIKIFSSFVLCEDIMLICSLYMSPKKLYLKQI